MFMCASGCCQVLQTVAPTLTIKHLVLTRVQPWSVSGDAATCAGVRIYIACCITFRRTAGFNGCVLANMMAVPYCTGLGLCVLAGASQLAAAIVSCISKCCGASGGYGLVLAREAGTESHCCY